MCPVCHEDYTDRQVSWLRVTSRAREAYRRAEVFPSWVVCMKLARHFVGPKHWWRRRGTPYTLAAWSEYASLDLRAMDQSMWMALGVLAIFVVLAIHWG